MLKHRLHTGLFCCCLAILVSRCALADGSAPAEASVSAEMPAAATTAPATTAGTDYEKQLHRLHATPVTSIGVLRDSYETLSGRYIELKGEIKGIIESVGQSTCFMAMDGSSVSLSIPDKLANSPALRPGTTTRLIATGNDHATANGPPLLIVAASNGQVTDMANQEQETTATVVTGQPDNGIVIVPPMTSMALPPSNRTSSDIVVRPGTSRQPRRTAAPAMNLDATLESQTSTYKAMALRFNPHLRDEQAQEIGAALVRAGYENNLDPRFLASIISVESDFDIMAKSPSGAMGLGQLMPLSVSEAGISDPWNPTQNIEATARLLRRKLNDYANRPNGTLLAVAAYNAGGGAVRRSGYNVPNGQQVQNYVWKVYYRYRELAPDMFAR